MSHLFPGPLRQSGARPERFDQRRLTVALAILTVSLAIVVTLTVNATVVGWERSSWVTQVAEPARAATQQVEAAILTRVQGVAGLRATGAAAFGEQVEASVRRERQALEVLYASSALIRPSMQGDVRALELALDTAWLRAGGGMPGSLGWAQEFQAYHRALEAAQAVEAVVVEEMRLRRNRTAAAEATASIGGLVLIPIAVCCLWIALRCVMRLRVAARLADERRGELERLSREKAGLVYDITRYLTQPLGTVAGRLATLEVSAGPLLDGNARGALTVAGGELRRALQILHDLGELSTADAGAMPIRTSTVDLATLLDATIGGLIGWASAKGVRLVLSPTLPGVTLATDADRLRGILRNLLASAIELASEGSVVQVDVSLHGNRFDGRAGPWIAIVISEEPLEVRGPAGLSTIELLKRQVGPSGELGLTLSQRVTTLLGGTLWSYGGGPGGARFALWLPANAAELREGGPAERESRLVAHPPPGE